LDTLSYIEASYHLIYRETVKKIWVYNEYEYHFECDILILCYSLAAVNVSYVMQCTARRHVTVSSHQLKAVTYSSKKEKLKSSFILLFQDKWGNLMIISGYWVVRMRTKVLKT